MSAPRPYVGRFAPSPTGPLHAGSLVAALASRLDALAHAGRWLVRIEDVDTPRTVPGATRDILETLAAFGFEWDGEPMVQSTRGEAYAQALARLQAMGRAYPCACTRKEIADSLTRAGQGRERHGELVYPGTCRHGMPPGRQARAWRVRVEETIDWTDRNGTHHVESLPQEVGDFVLRRADGLWAYQLAVVVDDAAQGVTDVVRGDDLAGSTARQILLQRLLQVPTPRYLHLPVVTDAHGEKLSKQTGATAIDRAQPLPALERALAHLGLPVTGADDLASFWRVAVPLWGASVWTGADSAPDPAPGQPLGPSPLDRFRQTHGTPTGERGGPPGRD